MMKERLSNIELLRIVSILLIVVMHMVGCVLGTSNEWNRLVLTGINAIGNMGVTVFMLISGYFGIHFRWSKLLILWLTALFYSLIAFTADFVSGTPQTTMSIFVALTPVTSRLWWFLSCYVVIFCLSPILNRLVEVLTRREMLFLLGILVFFFILSPTFLMHTLTGDVEGKGLANLLTAYLVGQYVSHHGFPEWLQKHCGTLLLISFAVAFLGSFVVGCIQPSATIIFCKDNNLLMAGGALCALCWTLQHPFNSRSINQLGSFAFPLYLSNWATIKLIQPYYLDQVNNRRIWGLLGGGFVVVLVIVFLLEFVRRLLLNSFLLPLNHQMLVWLRQQKGITLDFGIVDEPTSKTVPVDENRSDTAKGST